MGPSVEIAILAGGKSRRMGTDKSKLVLGGKSLLDRVKDIASGPGLPTRVIDRDVVESCGPLGGVITALRSSTAEAVLFLSVDMPFVPAASLDELVQSFRCGPGAYFCELNELAGFPFLLPVRILPAAERQFREGIFALHKLASKVDAFFIKVSNAMADDFLNINTPEDWNRAVARLVNRNAE